MGGAPHVKAFGRCPAIVLAAGLLLGPQVASALSQSQPDLLNLSMEELLQVPITSSTLYDENLKTVPSSMTVFTRADIRRLGLQNLNQLINLVPGYQGARSDDSVLNFAISSRGRRVGGPGCEVLVLLDGQRLNNDWTGGAGQHNQLIPLENVERVELIRGPGSALYGSNAMMGVINIITRSEREVTLATGTDGYRHGSAQWRADGAAGRLEVYANDTRSDGNDLTLFEPFPSPATPVWVDSDDPFRANDLYVRGQLGDWSLAALSTRRDMQKFYVAGYADDRSNSRDTRTDTINLGWQHQFQNDLALEGHVYRSVRDLDVRAAASLVPYYVLDGSTDEQEEGTRWILQGRFDQARWVLGWEWRHPELTDTSYHFGPPDNRFLVQRIQAEENGRIIQGLFGQYQQPLGQNLELIAGLRHDDYSDFGHHLSPRVGLVRQAGASDTFKLLYSEAFRAPSRLETSVISPEFQSNPDLKPETAQTAELIWLHFFEQGYLSATLFDTRIDDAIVENVTPLLRRTWINDELAVSGLELEWQQRWSDHWQSRLALTRLFQLDQHVSAEADSLLGGSVSYENAGWTFSLLANYQGPRQDANEQDFPADIQTTEYSQFGGHTLLGAHVGWAVNKALALFLNAENFSDKDYRSPANRAPNYEGVPGTGALFTLGLRWQLL